MKDLKFMGTLAKQVGSFNMNSQLADKTKQDKLPTD